MALATAIVGANMMDTPHAALDLCVPRRVMVHATPLPSRAAAPTAIA
jgi:hypothetical protein